MPLTTFRILTALLLLLPEASWVLAQTPTPQELADYRTLDRAITTKVQRSGGKTPAAQPGYLGVSTALEKGRLVVELVEADSPAAKAGLRKGDVLLRAGTQALKSPEDLRNAIQTQAGGEILSLTIQRSEKQLSMTPALATVSRPLRLQEQRVILGIQVGEPTSDGAPVTIVLAGSPAEASGVRVGDLVRRVEGQTLNSPTHLADILSEKKPGDLITLAYRRKNEDKEIKIPVASPGAGGPGGRGRGWDDGLPSAWTKDRYRLAIILVEYPDVKHNSKVTLKDWSDSLFSQGTYTKRSATGQPVFGSMRDYFKELSCGALDVEGKVFDWVEVSKKRLDYSEGPGRANKSALLVEAMDKLLVREGKEALKDFDGVFFLYAGDRVQTTRGGLYWPHRARFVHQGRRWNYFIVGEGGERMQNISVFCHEFGHMLGLIDLYARPENPGSEGLGVWCAMSNQLPNGRPQHFSAWCKEQLGWLKPTIIDPTVKQKLILSPILGSRSECLKVLIRPDGSEYLLLENRVRKGFDRDLPAEGLLIWRVVGGRPFLEESHGISGPAGPRTFPTSVPYPSEANHSFTPYTIPSSRSQLGGGLPVHLSQIRRLADGRIALQIGYEYQ